MEPLKSPKRWCVWESKYTPIRSVKMVSIPNCNYDNLTTQYGNPNAIINYLLFLYNYELNV